MSFGRIMNQSLRMFSSLIYLFWLTAGIFLKKVIAQDDISDSEWEKNFHFAILILSFSLSSPSSPPFSSPRNILPRGEYYTMEGITQLPAAYQQSQTYPHITLVPEYPVLLAILTAAYALLYHLISPYYASDHPSNQLRRGQVNQSQSRCYPNN